MTSELSSHSLSPDSVPQFVRATREGRAKGTTMTIVNDATGKRVTVRFRRPNKFQKILVDVMVGSDNDSHSSFKFIGSVPLAGELVYVPSTKSSAPQDKADFAKTVLNWTFRAVAQKDLKTVRVLHEAVCARCGKKLTVPSSIDNFLGPDCAALHGK